MSQIKGKNYKSKRKKKRHEKVTILSVAQKTLEGRQKQFCNSARVVLKFITFFASRSNFAYVMSKTHPRTCRGDHDAILF